MKKILSIFAAMLMAVAVNAKVWTVGPGHNEESDRTDCNLYVTLDRLAQPGDTILLADGEYIETLTMYVKGAAVIMADEGAKPVIKQSSYFKLKADAKFIGVKFQHVAESNGYCMYFQPGCSKLELQDCEITGFKETCMMSWDAYALNELIINNCYIHDNVKCVIYDPEGCIANTVITNSTIVNNDCSPWSAAPIDIRKGSSTDHTLLIDHCTFYNNKVSSDSYADIRPRGLNGVKVKNCIFAHPEAYAARATRFVNDDTVEGCEVINCLTFNYTKNTDRFGHYTGSELTNCAAGDPLFENAAEGNFNLGENSPALTMNAGAPIGDPRWAPAPAPAVVLPQIQLIGNMNGWTGEDFFVPANDGLTASLTMNLTKNEALGYEFKLNVGNAPNVNCLSIDNGETMYGFHRGWTTAQVKYISETSKPMFVKVDVDGAYTFTWTYADSTLTIAFPDAPLPTVALAGSMNSWSENADILVPAENKLTASITKTLEANTDYELKMVVDGHWLAKDNTYELHRGWPTVDNVSSEIPMGPNIVLKADVAGAYVFTWEYATNNLTVTFPSATAINNTEAEVKAVKMMENGQMIIIKNGVKYNVLGSAL